MIDFNTLPCAVASGASVGIGFDNDNKSTLYLPIGYSKIETADAKKEAFFELYRLFNAYVKKNNLKNEDYKESETGGQNTQKGGYSLRLKDDDESSVILYSKVNFLDTILDAFDPYAIKSIVNRAQYSEEYQLEEACNYLDEALFLDDDTFMVDEALTLKAQIQIEPSELAKMFCFIYLDVQTQLNQSESVSTLFVSLAEAFKEAHLFPNASLFEADGFEQVKILLKARLELIERHTVLKDNEFEKLREAIYLFLYGDPIKGENKEGVWGIKNFHPIWEELCLEAVAGSGLKKKVWMADTQRKDLFGDESGTKKIGTRSVYFEESAEKYPFKLCMGSGDGEKNQKKYIYPDLVITPGDLLGFQDASWNSESVLRFGDDMSTKACSIQLNMIKFYNLHATLEEENFKDYHFLKQRDQFFLKVKLIIDFKYKTDIGLTDKVKQYLYMHSYEDFSFSEFWIPGGTECEGIPNNVGCFKDHTRKNIKTRTINIKSLVQHYIGGNDVK
ncbi:MAG: hypothetical protein GXO35_08620 [Gammaproteobacteria bacterium]|nr:hypothetical protein [Gammaproteobacteria bacterium]